MKLSTRIVSGIASGLFLTAVLGWLVCLSHINNHAEVLALNYPLLAAVIAAAFLLDLLMVEKNIPAPLYITAQLVFGAAAVWSFTAAFTMIEPYKLGTVIIFSAFWCVFVISMAFVASMPSTRSAMTGRFDILALMLVVLFVLDKLVTLSNAVQAELMCGAALAVCVMALVSDSVGRVGVRGSAKGAGAAGRLMLAAAAAVIAALAAGVYFLASGRVHSLTELIKSAALACWGGIKAAAAWLWQMFDRFMTWLVSFVDPMEMEAVGGSTETASDVAVDMSGMDVSVPWYFYAVLIAVAVALIIFIIWKLRGLRVGRAAKPRRRAASAKRDSLFASTLSSLLDNWRAALRYRVNCVRLRRTAPGLLALCERRAPAQAKRRSGESGERFLTRLAASRPDDTSRAALTELAELVERAFYAPAPAAVPAELYKAVRAIRF
ncbi:MAG: hypothetical protein LUD55_06395 [Oscillospiraceae bacterium]|nr:hypothetical protein [Oscillospiraceae bacterium]